MVQVQGDCINDARLLRSCCSFFPLPPCGPGGGGPRFPPHRRHPPACPDEPGVVRDGVTDRKLTHCTHRTRNSPLRLNSIPSSAMPKHRKIAPELSGQVCVVSVEWNDVLHFYVATYTRVISQVVSEAGAMLLQRLQSRDQWITLPMASAPFLVKLHLNEQRLRSRRRSGCVRSAGGRTRRCQRCNLTRIHFPNHSNSL